MAVAGRRVHQSGEGGGGRGLAYGGGSDWVVSIQGS